MKSLSYLLTVTAAIALAGCVGKAPAPQAGPDVVRLGCMANVTHAAALLGSFGNEKGYKDAAPEIEVDAKVFNAGPSIVEALRAGALDVAVIGVAPAINAYWRGKDIVVLTNMVDGGTALVARAGSGIKSVNDLAGRKVAVPQIGNTQDVLLRYQLARNGLRPSAQGGAVDVLPVENSSLPNLFRRNQLDAACVPEPWATRLRRETGATVVLGPGQLFNDGRYSTALLVTRRDFADSHPRAIQALIRATDAITRAIAVDPQLSVPSLTAAIHAASGRTLPAGIVAEALCGCRFTTEIRQEELTAFAAAMKDAGYNPRDAGSLDGIVWK